MYKTVTQQMVLNPPPFFVVLNIEPSASSMVGKYSIIELHPNCYSNNFKKVISWFFLLQALLVNL